MLEHLPQEIRDGLEIARQRRARRQAKLRVQIGDAAFPVLRLWSPSLLLSFDPAFGVVV